MPNMRKLLPLLILLTLVACDKSGTSSYANTSLKADPALKGIWKLVSVRFAGGNVQDMKTLYAFADPENSNLSLFLAVEEEADNGQGPVIDVLRLAADGDKLDSSTTKGNMSTIADCTDAWVQTYSIEDQFKKGARYFDFRVGSSLVPCWLPLRMSSTDTATRCMSTT